MNDALSLAPWKYARNKAARHQKKKTIRKHKKDRAAGSYDKMLIDWVWSGRTRKYLALGHDARTSLRSVRTSWPRAKYFPVRPSHSVNKYIISINKFTITQRPLSNSQMHIQGIQGDRELLGQWHQQEQIPFIIVIIIIIIIVVVFAVVFILFMTRDL